MKISGKKPRAKVSRRLKILFVAVSLFILLCLAVALLRGVNRFFDGHYFQFNRVVELTLNKPIEIKRREVISPIVEYVRLLDYPDDIDTDLERYICEKFGQYECKTALAVAKSESKLQEGAFHVNSNGTVDIGIFQINSIHFGRSGCSLKEIASAQGNVDCAYSLWSEQGWHPWVVFKNGSFIRNY